MAAPTLEERTSRLEGGYDHLATKADLEGVRTDMERLRADMERNRAEIREDMQRLRADVSRWLLQLGVAVVSAIGVASGIILAVIKLT